MAYEYTAKGQSATISSGMAGSLQEATLMQRLTMASDRIDSICQNLELFLARVNGAPPVEGATVNKAQPQGPRSLVSLVASAEGQADHLRDISTRIEKIG